MNTKISMEAELVGVDYASGLILYAKLFLESQVYKDKEHIFIKIIKVLSYYSKMVTRV